MSYWGVKNLFRTILGVDFYAYENAHHKQVKSSSEVLTDILVRFVGKSEHYQQEQRHCGCE